MKLRFSSNQVKLLFDNRVYQLVFYSINSRGIPKKPEEWSSYCSGCVFHGIKCKTAEVMKCRSWSRRDLRHGYWKEVKE